MDPHPLAPTTPPPPTPPRKPSPPPPAPNGARFQEQVDVNVRTIQDQVNAIQN